MGVTAPDAALLRFAEEVGDSGPVGIEGARSRWATGGSLASGTRLVKAPRGVVTHRPEEMTVRVRAGTMVAELHSELAPAGQRTALARRGGTVGGALAVGENDVSVLGRGRLRDAVLQVRYVSSEGAIVTGGGPTVKNVTGFDLPRLFVGSLGTLGFIAEVTLRTNPVPAVSRWFRAEGADPFAVLSAAAQPSAILWDRRTTWVELEGHVPDVDEERQALDRCAGDGGWAECGGPPQLPAHRWSLPPAELRNLNADELGPFVASIGVGTVFASRPAPRRAMPAALEQLTERMKHEFDPVGRLNPGRSVVPVAT